MSVGFVLAATAGGTGAHVAMLAEGCAGAGMTVTVYGPTSAGQRFFASGARGFVTVDIGSRPRPARDVAAVARLRRLLARAGHDVVHAHGLRAGALAALALSGLPKRPPLLVTVHNAPPAPGARSAIYGLLERLVARRADAVSCVSGDLAARMARLGAHDVGRAVVPAPSLGQPSDGAVAAVRAELRSHGRPVVLAVGRLTEQKGFAALLSAAVRWRGRDPAPLLAIAGEGPLEQPLRVQADRDGLDVRFLGRRDDVPALLAAADVVVAPSRWEGQPLVVQEALRAGRPVVACRVGGILDLTGEDGAVLTPPDDPERLATAVVAVLDDPGRAAALAGAARARAALLPSPADAVTAAVTLYQRLAGPSVRRPPGPARRWRSA